MDAGRKRCRGGRAGDQSVRRFFSVVKGEDIPESLKSVVEGAIEKTGGKLKQPVVKVPDSGLIKSKTANEEISVTEIQKLGKINIKVLEKEFGKIQTDDSKFKNSVMTFYRIRERNLKKLIEKMVYFIKRNRYCIISIY